MLTWWRVDPDGHISEIDEDNNKASTDVTVKIYQLAQHSIFAHYSCSMPFGSCYGPLINSDETFVARNQFMKEVYQSQTVDFLA